MHVFDLGQNMVGWVRLAVEGERGTRVRLRFAEMLEPDGTLYIDNLRSARQLDTYVLARRRRRGLRAALHLPRLPLRRGDRARRQPGSERSPAASCTPTRRAAARSSAPTRSSTSSGSNIVWGQRGNFVSVPTDCPQRDERLGWIGDAQVFLPTATLNMDVAAFFTKWGDDVLDAQSPDGAYSDVAPRLVLERDGAPAWADAGVIVPWTLWRRYGDVRLVERHWDAMERYLAYLQRHNPDLLWTPRRGNDYGDWLAVGEETPRERARHGLLGLRRRS